MHCVCVSSEILGSRGGEYEVGCLLGCRVVLSGRSLLTFQGFLLISSSEHRRSSDCGGMYEASHVVSVWSYSLHLPCEKLK
jgi:hypothetical protein